MLQLFATIMYFVGAVASIPAAILSKWYGRTMTMTLAGTAFLVGESSLLLETMNETSDWDLKLGRALRLANLQKCYWMLHFL